MTDRSDFLMARVQHVAPGYYTESDGGDWYVLDPEHDRVAEGFRKRDDARRGLLWLGGDPLPEGWSFTPVPVGARHGDLSCGQYNPATIWLPIGALVFGRRPPGVGNGITGPARAPVLYRTPVLAAEAPRNE